MYGALLCARLREAILADTHFHCSAGVAWNKTLAKIVCAMHKPRQQTILTPEYLRELYRRTKITSMRNLGGKMGLKLANKFAISASST